jgi:hypothetical protein
VQVWGLKGECTAGTGRCVNIEGNSAGIFVTGMDLGPVAFAHEGIVIQASGGNSPNNITIHGGIVEGTTPCISITGATTNVVIDGVIVLNAQTSGVSVGGTATQITLSNLVFVTSGVVAGTNYDLVWSSSGNGLARGCRFTTPQGTSSGQVTAAINPSGSGPLYVDGNLFQGAQAFNANFPKKAANNVGYNPVGNVTAPTMPSSGSAQTNPFGSDAYVTVTGGTVSAIAIGGVSTGLTSGSFLVPWNQTITITYSAAPTWKWFLS